MKALANELEKMDKYFSGKKESEKWLIILGIAGIISFLAYSYLLPYAEESFRTSEAEKNRLTKSIADQNAYLASITIGGDRNFYITKYDQDIQKKKGQIIDLDKRIAHINSSLEKLSGLLFNQKSWATFLDSITENAKIHNIEIEFINNKYVDSQGNFGHVLEVEIGSTSDYKNLIEFLHEMEQNILVTDVYSSNLVGTSEGVNSDINISVWGINH